MSYILDALRRAQAERSRGDLPGLHSPTPTLTPAPAADLRPSRGAWLALLALLLAGGLGLGGWWLGQQQNRTGQSASADGPAPSLVATAPARPVTTAAAPPPSTATPGAISAAPPGAAPATTAPAHTARTPRAAAPPTSTPNTAAAAAPAPGSPAKAGTAPAQPTASPAPAQPSGNTGGTGTVFAPADLPPAIRAQLPTLQLAGITYSHNPQHRMAIVNGQVLHEGERAAPELVLERIEPGRTIWVFHGYRWALAAP